MKLPDFLRKPAGAVQLKPEQQKISGYFNLDNGSGKIQEFMQENDGMRHLPAVDRAFRGPWREHADHEEYGRD